MVTIDVGEKADGSGTCGDDDITYDMTSLQLIPPTKSTNTPMTQTRDYDARI